jgi:type I restriction enzyme S subunit
MVALGEMLRLAMDGEPVDPERQYPNLGIYGFGRGVFTKPDIAGTATSAKTLYRVKSGQFIYSRLFAFEGAYSTVPAELDGYYVSNEFPTFDWMTEKAESRFVGWAFRYAPTWEAAARLGVGMGNRRRRVHPESLLAYRIPLPPLAEQRRIVARLDAVATRLTARTEAVQRLEADLTALLRATFTRITIGSTRARMADIAPLVRRPVDVEPTRLYPELGVRSFGRGTFHKPNVSGIDLGSKRVFRIEPGDLLFNNVFAWEGAVAIAAAADAGRVGSHRFITCVADRKRVSTEFLRFFFLSNEGIQLLGQASPGGAGRNRTLGLESLMAIEVPVPSLDAQQWFDRLQAKVNATRAQHAAITAEADTLLPAMLHQVFGEAPC